jgi:prephenate dehydratase
MRMTADPISQKAAVELWYGARKQSAQSPIANRTTDSPTGEIHTGMKIAIQGEPGSFSHEATLALVPDAVIVPCTVSADVFKALTDGTVDGAVIPIENSLAGSVLEHFDLLLQHDVKVVRESQLRIRHNLIGISSTLDDIDRVFSHPVALAQCRRFLADHPKMESFAFYDTAGSVKQLVELRDRHAAAIASEAAAKYYGAQILRSGIEDNPENFTRFFLVRRAEDARFDPASNKTSIAFSVENRPGSLVAALNELSAMGTNLTKIESRPVHGKPWEYVFYVDCQLHSSEEGSRAITVLKPHCAMVKELGRYVEAGTRQGTGIRD